MYADGQGGHVLPKCTCNYRYELFGENPMRVAAREVEFVMGHCHGREFKECGRVAYLGNWGSEEKVELYRHV